MKNRKSNTTGYHKSHAEGWWSKVMAKIKAYTFSIMALNKLEALQENSPAGVYYGHRSGITVSPYIDAVALEAREAVFNIFPVSEGWSNHDVVVTPISERFFAGLQTYIDQGLFTGEADAAEETKNFHFGSDPTRIVLDADVSDTEQ